MSNLKGQKIDRQNHESRSPAAQVRGADYAFHETQLDREHCQLRYRGDSDKEHEVIAVKMECAVEQFTG